MADDRYAMAPTLADFSQLDAVQRNPRRWRSRGLNKSLKPPSPPPQPSPLSLSYNAIILVFKMAPVPSLQSVRFLFSPLAKFSWKIRTYFTVELWHKSCVQVLCLSLGYGRLAILGEFQPSFLCDYVCFFGLQV
jgi:hypothetical protein